MATEIFWVRSMELVSCFPTGDWNFVGPQYGACFMSANWRLKFCTSAVWNLLYVCQLATEILYVRSMELASCLPTGDWNFVGPQYGTCFISPSWRLEFCGSAVWNLLPVCQLATGILCVSSMEHASCLPTGEWNFVCQQYGTCFMSPYWRMEFCGSAVWILLHVSQLATRILWSPPPWRNILQWTSCFTITLRQTTVSRTPLDEWTARRRDFYPTTHNTHNKQTSMLPAGCEPTIPASERPVTYVLDRAATGMGAVVLIVVWISSNCRPTDEFVVCVLSMCYRTLCDFNKPVLILIIYPFYRVCDLYYPFVLMSLID